MGTITLNGTTNTAIEGLIIQSLPSITKPLIRTSVEEIDGRDGDIVTRLGYAAYDRELKVGLKAKHDIDAVIAYFNSEGEAIFSNEPDKVYQYKILQEIDFNRLLRFREATVRMHVQPFKLSATEEPVVLTAQGSVTNSGNVVSAPIFTVEGSGDIDLYVNGSQVLAIRLGDEGSIVIDVARMEAYRDGILKNRLVTGDYNNAKLGVGQNEITWTGNLTKLTIDKYSRWV